MTDKLTVKRIGFYGGTVEYICNHHRPQVIAFSSTIKFISPTNQFCQYCHTEPTVEEIIANAKASQARLADLAPSNCPSFSPAEPGDLGEMPIDTYIHNQSETYGTDEYWEKLRDYK